MTDALVRPDLLLETSPDAFGLSVAIRMHTV